jgi:hypothetical protein
MTDRFYPLGLESDKDVWKTTYEVMNEMRSFERSAYPPGTAIHLPGARQNFGYSSPGPIASRLANSSLALTEQTGIPNPREHHAITRIQVPDDREVFENLDVPEMMRSYNSPVATMSLSPGKMSTMSRTRSLPAIERREAPPRLSQPLPAISKIEDDHFTYFVPKGLSRESRDKLNMSTLSKLKKDYKVSFPFSGEGTGFRTQSGGADWWPKGKNHLVPTAYKSEFANPGFFRKTSPVFHSQSASSVDLR